MREIPIVAPTPQDGYWVLMDDVKISIDCGEIKRAYFIPKGFVTDFASIPRPLWWFASPTDYPVLRASLLHDYLYRTGHRIDRKYADKLFYKLMVEDGMPRWKAKLVYWAVRIFAKRAWEGYRRNREDEE